MSERACYAPRMSGGMRTVFFGLIGILICLAIAFVLHQQRQQRLRAGEKTTEQAPTRRAAPTSRPAADRF